MPQEIQAIADDISAGRKIEPVTVRTFLSWFDAQRRGPNIVQRIRAELEKNSLETFPDFESQWIYAKINFRSTADQKISPKDAELHASTFDAEISLGEAILQNEDSVAWITRDATYRISKLEAANQYVTRIGPEGTIAEAVTLLLARDFSQIAVMTNDRDVKGVISWQSIGSRLALGNRIGAVQEFMEPHHEVRSELSIFDAIPVIRRYGYVLVRGDQNQITGIVTANDLSLQFQVLSEPFLLLGEIENLIRNMIGKNFSAANLSSFVENGNESRTINGIDDLNFGEYIRILQDKDRWAKLSLKIDRILFCRDLDEVRKIRNDVMHFDPDGITDDDIKKLRNFKSLLETLDIISK